MSQPHYNTEYLDIEAVAAKRGIKVKTVREYLSRSAMPEPDLVFKDHPLWLPETIEAWNRRDKIYRPRVRRVPRTKRVRTQDSAGTGEPVRVPRVEPKGPKPYVRKRRDFKIETDLARDISAYLRERGFHCTTEDVKDLGTFLGDLDPGREELRQRILSRLRASGLKV